MLKPLKYVNSQGKVVDFRKFETVVYKAQFHSSTWTVETVTQQYGVSISTYGKEPLELEMSIAVRSNQKADVLNNIFEIFETDIINNTLGKLYFGESYVNCVIISNTTLPSEEFYGAENTFSVYVPYPFWIRETENTFFTETVTSTDLGLDYPYNYTYDYTPEPKGVALWYVDHFAPSDFQITIYGECVNPRILINGYPYEVFVTLQKNEYLIIDSTNNNNTVTQYRSNGTTVNLFDLRGGKDTNQSIFKKIPSGNLKINWSGNFSFSVKLFLERGVPKW